MANSYVNPKLPVLWHGGDYNPDQWLDDPKILAEDIRLMKKSNCNVLSTGIFAWSTLEPQEGVYNFEWLDSVFDSFEANGLYVNLATPSGARPPWMALKYPEVLRVDAERRKQHFGGRHNHCYTSPIYREKVRQINTALAQRYAKRKALVLWHLSNEYGGECHCELCQAAFRDFLKEKYGTLEKLNKAWCSAFWSHGYTAWEQIESPSPIGESNLHGLKLDWRRFASRQTCDFMAKEAEPLRKFTPEVPITTNLMGFFQGFSQHEMAPIMDVSSWDAYPSWDSPEGNFATAQATAMAHDLTRSLKPGKPFLLMESTPSITNWQPCPKLKRPGMHKLSSLLATASGADSVMYFQWRKSRGSCEKFHGAVVGHEGHEDTRTFRDVEELGKTLLKIEEVAGSLVDAKAAIIADWENSWALNDAKCLFRDRKEYWNEFVRPHHAAFFKLGVATDIIGMDMPFEPYKLIVAPALYMVKKGVAERLEKFVAAGGTLVLTFWSGLVDENDLCYLSDAPGPLRKLAGLRAEEIDCLYDEESNSMSMEKGNELGVSGRFQIARYCEIVKLEGAKALASYDSEFYAGTPALTVNELGKGKVYYLAANAELKLLEKIYGKIAEDAGAPRATGAKLPEGVVARRRKAEKADYLFLMNLEHKEKSVDLKKESWTDLESGKEATGKTTLPPLGVLCLKSN